MRTVGGTLVLAWFGLASSRLALAAQAPGLPVVNAGAARGLTLAGRVGFPNRAAGSGTAYEIAATLGARRIALTGLAAFHRRPGYVAEDYTSLGANLSYKVFGGPLVPLGLTLQAGAAYATPRPLSLPGAPGGAPAYDGTLTIWHVPIGLGLAWTIARPVVAIRPWVAPRLDVRYVRTPALVGGVGQPIPESSTTDAEFGLSGGVSFGFLNGISIDAALDRMLGSPGAKPTTFSMGLSVAIR